MKTVINKLVRDEIPDIIKNQGKKCKTSIIPKEDFKKELYKKLIEEMEELKSAIHYDFENNVLEELADVVTVTLSIIGYDIDDLVMEYQYKGEEKGYFNSRVYLHEVTEEDDDE